MARPFKWVVEIEVDPSWVADGFDMNDERAHSMLAKALPYAYNHELKARVLRAPSADRIARQQGYKSARDPRLLKHKGRS
jgi:hypothetical protein